MKHTPGPWKILRGKKIDSSLYLKVLQSESNPHLHIKAYSITQETADANAHLIAAAPELLEAGVALLKAAREGGQNIPQYLAEAWGMLFDAITKAGGRAEG